MSNKTIERLRSQIRGVRRQILRNNKNSNVAENNENMTFEQKIKNRLVWFLISIVSFAVLVTAFVVIYLFVTDTILGIDIDTATVLTTLLAFFSILLSAIFYFKATEQSNKFYDRSNTHTKDIAENLSRMDGKFGEALKNIEQYSTRLNERFDNLPQVMNSYHDNVRATQMYLQEISDKIQKGELSDEEVKQYEKKFTDLQNENNLLKDQIEKNEILNNQFDKNRNLTINNKNKFSELSAFEMGQKFNNINNSEFYKIVRNNPEFLNTLSSVSLNMDLAKNQALFENINKLMNQNEKKNEEQKD